MWLRNDCVGVLRYRSGTPVSGVAAGEPPRRLGSVGQNDPAPSATKRLWTKSPKHVYEAQNARMRETIGDLEYKIGSLEYPACTNA
jgi:hypothetical protein